MVPIHNRGSRHEPHALAVSGVVRGVNLPWSRAYAVADSDTTPAVVNLPFFCRSDSPGASKSHSGKSWNPLAPVVRVHNRKKPPAIHAEGQRSLVGTNFRYAIVVFSEARASLVCTERHLSKRGKSKTCLKMMKTSSKSGACKLLETKN
jgi:hypothetical protein